MRILVSLAPMYLCWHVVCDICVGFKKIHTYLTSVGMSYAVYVGFKKSKFPAFGPPVLSCHGGFLPRRRMKGKNRIDQAWPRRDVAGIAVFADAMVPLRLIDLSRGDILPQGACATFDFVTGIVAVTIRPATTTSTVKMTLSSARRRVAGPDCQRDTSCSFQNIAPSFVFELFGKFKLVTM